METLAPGGKERLNGTGALRAAWIGAGLTGIAVVIASLAPSHWRTWGLDGFLDLHPVSVALWITVSLAVSFGIGLLLKHGSGWIESTRFPYGPIFIIVFGLMVLIIPAATFLRGDGQLLINHLRIGESASFRSPLYAMIVGFIAEVGDPFRVAPRGIYLLVDVVAAVIYAAAALRFCRQFRSISGRILAVTACVFTGSMPLLFGLVEHYALLHALLIWVIVLAMESLNKEKYPWPSLILNIIAVGFHFSAVVLLPAYLLPLGKRIGRRIAFTGFCLTGVVAMIAASIFFRQHLMAPPGLTPEDGYTLLSLRHIIDLVNLDFWSIPVLIGVVLPAILFGGAALRGDNVSRFLLGGTAGAVAFIFWFAPDLGMARDADLLAVYAIPATFWVLHQLLDKETTITPIICSAALFAGSITVGAQTMLQHDEDRYVRRFIRQLQIDPSRSAYGYESLAVYYRDKGDPAGEEAAYIKALEQEENHRYLARLGHLLLDRGAVDESEQYCKRALLVEPGFALAHGIRGNVLARKGHNDQALVEFRKAIELEPDVGTHWANLAAFMVTLGNYSEAEDIVLEGLNKAEPNAQLYHLYGSLLQKLGRNAEALEALEQTIQLDPGGIWGYKANQLRKQVILTP